MNPLRAFTQQYQDDPKTRDELVAALTDHGLSVDMATTSRQGLSRAVGGDYDAIVLDRMLPGETDGIGVLRALRQVGIRTPVLVLSALGSVEERVVGLRAGGDDYMVKPFSFDELTARLDNLLLRDRVLPKAAHSETLLVLGELCCDRTTRTARNGEITIDLLQKEWMLLEDFMRKVGQVLTRAMIFEEVWGYYQTGSENVIDVHVSRLRRKLEAVCVRAVIVTLRGKGYMLRAAD